MVDASQSILSVTRLSRGARLHLYGLEYIVDVDVYNSYDFVLLTLGLIVRLGHLRCMIYHLDLSDRGV